MVVNQANERKKVYFCDTRGDIKISESKNDSCKITVMSQNTQFIQDDRSIRPFFFAKTDKGSKRKILRQWLVLYDMKNGKIVD